jgi:hypothetical protein
MESHKMSAWQPFKNVFATPMFARVKILVLEVPYADQLGERLKGSRRGRIVCTIHKCLRDLHDLAEKFLKKGVAFDARLMELLGAITGLKKT